jgi:hypothetical protein
MAIQINFPDLNWGDKFFIDTDPDQLERSLVGILLVPGSTNKKRERGTSIFFNLSLGGEITSVHEFEVSKTRDELKFMENKETDDDDDA